MGIRLVNPVLFSKCSEAQIGKKNLLKTRAEMNVWNKTDHSILNNKSLAEVVYWLPKYHCERLMTHICSKRWQKEGLICVVNAKFKHVYICWRAAGAGFWRKGFICKKVQGNIREEIHVKRRNSRPKARGRFGKSVVFLTRALRLHSGPFLQMYVDILKGKYLC